MPEAARWSALRQYLTTSAEATEGAAVLCGDDRVMAVRFRAEALGYRNALEKMTELEAAGDE